MKIRGTSTLQTDMLFLLIAVSYMLLASVSFDQQDDSQASIVEQAEENIERIKVLVAPGGTFEIVNNKKRGARVDMRQFIRSGNGVGVEIHPAPDVMWRDIQIIYVFLSRNGVDVIIKPFSGGT